MQVGTYPTRNFATLGPLWLQPPFTGNLIQSFKKPLLIIFQHRAGIRSYISSLDLAESCVLIKQSLSQICVTFIKRYSLSRSYRAILPSSFSIVISNTLIFSINLPVSVLVRFLKLFLVFSRKINIINIIH